jgi:hypothetical protein
MSRVLSYAMRKLASFLAFPLALPKKSLAMASGPHSASRGFGVGLVRVRACVEAKLQSVMKIDAIQILHWKTWKLSPILSSSAVPLPCMPMLQQSHPESEESVM